MTNGTSARRTTGRALVVALVLAVALGACSGGGGSPRETLTQLRAASASGDGRTFYDAFERETRAHLCDRMRNWKAALAAGDPSQEFLAQLPLPPDVIRGGEPEALVIRWLSEASPLAYHRGWFDGATVVAEETRSERERGLRLRGTDGVERVMWFIREGDRWALDYLQTRWLHGS